MNHQIEQLIAIASDSKLKHAFIHNKKAVNEVISEFTKEVDPHKAFLVATNGDEAGLQMHSTSTTGEHHKAFLVATNGDEIGLQMHATPSMGEHHKAFLAGPAS